MEQFKETRHTKIQTTKSMMICLFTTCDFDNSTILLLQVVKLYLFLRIAILFFLIDPIQKFFSNLVEIYRYIYRVESLTTLNVGYFRKIEKSCFTYVLVYKCITLFCIYTLGHIYEDNA